MNYPFHHSDTDSDEERAEKKRKTLHQIQSEKHLTELNAAASPKEEDEKSHTDALNEEQELQALRNSQAYQLYAEKTGRQTEAKNDQKKEKKPPNETVNESIQKSKNSTDQTSNSHRLMSENAIEGSSSNSVRKMSTQPTAVKSLNSKIDPKIIDDSSDESDSEGERISDDDDDDNIGPVLPSSTNKHDKVSNPLEKLPVQHAATFSSQHDAYVSCLTLDKTGTRFFSGSVDSSVMLWDFNSMTRSLKSFKTVNPFEESPVQSIQFSPTGGLVACAGASTSAMIMDRNGEIQSQTAKGDMYIVDMARTKGHVGHIKSVLWKPDLTTSSPLLLTASLDSTIRLWDVSRAKRVPMSHVPIIPQLRLLKLRNARGGKMIANTVDWLPNGKHCALGCSDGTVKIVDPESGMFRALNTTNEFVEQGVDITSVKCAPSNSPAPLILVRSMDDSLRVFDQRNMSLPVKQFDDLPNAVAETNACFVGDTCDYFVTGTSANRKGGSPRGTLRLYSRQLLKEVWRQDMEETTGSVTYLTWHNKLNQIMYGTGDGSIRVLYHEQESRKGILSCLSKEERRKVHGAVSLGVGEIYTGAELHQIGINARKRRNGPGGDVTVNAEAQPKRARQGKEDILNPQTIVQPPRTKLNNKSLAKQLAAKEVSEEWSRDPRVALLSYAEVAEKDPKFTKAYKETQPQIILAEKTAEEEEEENKRQIYNRDRLKNVGGKGVE